MTVKLYNTLTRKIEEFKPIKKGKAGFYSCGPTVYNYAHIGNLRAFIFEDILKRTLEFNGYKVKHIMNITDVGHLTGDTDDTGEDKMEKGAAREGKTAWDIAKFYTEAFFKDLKELNIQPATKYPRATDHIKEQIAIVKKLEKKGFTYKTSDGIYFDTSKLPDYGKLAGLKKDSLQAGVRVEMGEKKNPTDFALWKFSPTDKKRQMEWKSPWGVGFPGWHIECSAMSAKYLGIPFDIHAGGIDHIPVHHTNEIAQTEAAEGKPLANYWLHSEFLNIGEKKMAKSGNNFLTLQSLKDNGISPLAYRFFLLQAHYRKQLSFSWEALEAAKTGYKNLIDSIVRSMVRDHQAGSNGSLSFNYTEKFNELISNDLSTPEAISLLFNLLNEKGAEKEIVKTIEKFDEVLGLDLIAKAKKKIQEMKNPASVSSEAQKLATDRDEARKNKNWAESDRLRSELEKLGYLVEDTKEGTKIKHK